MADHMALITWHPVRKPREPNAVALSLLSLFNLGPHPRRRCPTTTTSHLSYISLETNAQRCVYMVILNPVRVSIIHVGSEESVLQSYA